MQTCRSCSGRALGPYFDVGRYVGLVLTLVCWGGCQDDSPPSAAKSDAGASERIDASALSDGFFSAKPLAFRAGDDAAKTIQVSASGEALGTAGYSYSAEPSPDQPVFVDGWELRFDRYLVVIGEVLVSEQGADPDMRGVLGATVIERKGPWIVDVHKRGPLVGAGGAPETAVPLLILSANFDPTRSYAFSFETVSASYAVQNTNLVAADSDALQQMIDHGWVKYFAGTATYRGRAPSDSVDPSFRDYPTVVKFAFGIGDPARYVNCHNPEIGDEDEPANRGVRPSDSGTTRAQLTFHTDHFFWDQADVEGTPLRFDPLAARASDFGDDSAAQDLSMADLQDVSPSALSDVSGAAVRDRGDQTQGYRSDVGAPPVFASNGIAEITDLRSFVAYNNRGQGHLNSDGLCLVEPTAPLSF